MLAIVDANQSKSIGFVKVTNRFVACIFHFLMSAVFFFALLAVLLFLWYPSPYFLASGGWQGLLLVAGVDLVLGPLLTLVVYNKKKSRRELFTDLGFIVLIQLSALIWGIKAVYYQRPVAVVFLDTSFFTVPAAAVVDQGVELDLLNEFGSERPVYVSVQRPNSGEDLERFEHEVYELQISPHEQVWLYQPLDENFATIRRSSVDIEEVMAVNADMKADIEDILDDTGTALHDNYYIPLTSRYRNIIIVFGAQGQILGTVSGPFKSGDV